MILGAIFLLVFPLSAFSQSAYIASSAIQQSIKPTSVFFIYWVDPTSPKLAEGRFSYTGKTLTAVAQFQSESSEVPKACMIMSNASGESTECASTRVFPLTLSGQPTELALKAEIEKRKGVNRALRQEVLDKEVKLRAVRDKVGALVKVDELVSVRNKRIETDIQNASLQQELETVEKSLADLRQVPVTDMSQLIERSLIGALSDLQKLSIVKVKK